MKQSIDHIINKYKASIFKICLGYSKSTQDAEDLLQEVYINVWKGLKSFRNEANIKTWLYRVTVNTCLLTLRKKSIDTVSLNKIDEALLSSSEKDSEEGTFQKLHDLIQELPKNERVIILLYLEDLTHKEIANIVGIKPNYVGVKINRIKKILSKK